MSRLYSNDGKHEGVVEENEEAVGENEDETVNDSEAEFRDVEILSV